MPWYKYGGQLYEASPEDAQSWGGAELVPSYTSQQGEQYQYAPELVGREGWQAPSATIYHGSNLLELLDKQGSGQPLSLADQSKLEEVMRGTEGLPTRDWRTLLYPNEGTDQPGQRARYPAITDPDYLPMLRQVYQAAEQGDEQARTLLPELRKFQEFATYNATRKQDNFSPLGDPFFGALGILGLGASAGAIAPLFAGGAGLGTTLGGLGALSGTLGQGAGMLGEALDVPGLRKAGSVLGALGGIAGGVGGLTNLWGTGIHSLGDVGRLASSAGRITGGLGTLTDSDILRQAGGYLGAAGQIGSGAQTIGDVFGGGVSNLTDAARLASGAGQIAGAVGRAVGNRPMQQVGGVLGMGSRLGGGVGNLLGAAQQAQQRGMAPVQRTMSDTDWLGRNWQPGPWQQPQPVLWNL